MDNTRELNVGIYVRISSDRTGDGLGVTRQTKDCSALAKARGASSVQIYEDNDVSAFSGRTRPAYEAMMQAVAAGAIDVVLAWHTDRLHRSPLELERYISLCELYGVQTWTVQGGDLDLNTSSGRAAARIFGTMARQESERKAERLRSKHAELAAAGEWASGSRVYGFQVVRSVDSGTDSLVGTKTLRGHSQVVVVEDEAAIIRECADGLLSGTSLRSMVIQLQLRGVPTLRGGEWSTSTLRQILAAARNSGQREWTPRGTEGKRGYGFGPIICDGDWPAILTKEETARIRALLSDPSRKLGPCTTQLLSGGLLCCQLCGEPMNSRTSKAGGRTYACIRVPGRKRCGRMSIVADPADAVILELAIRRLSTIDRTRLADPVDAERDGNIDQARERLREITKLYGSLKIDSETFNIANDELQRIIARSPEVRQQPKRDALHGMPNTVDDIRTWWHDLPLVANKAVLENLMERVECQPSTMPRGHSKFQPARLSVTWRS